MIRICAWGPLKMYSHMCIQINAGPCCSNFSLLLDSAYINLNFASVVVMLACAIGRGESGTNTAPSAALDSDERDQLETRYSRMLNCLSVWLLCGVLAHFWQRMAARVTADVTYHSSCCQVHSPAVRSRDILSAWYQTIHVLAKSQREQPCPFFWSSKTYTRFHILNTWHLSWRNVRADGRGFWSKFINFSLLDSTWWVGDHTYRLCNCVEDDVNWGRPFTW